MQRYLAPTWVYLSAILMFGLATRFDAGSRVSSGLLMAALALYVAASLWWVVSATRPARATWPHMIAVWLPAALPLGLFLWSLAAMKENDSAALVAMAYVGPAVLALATCAIGAFAIFDRMAWPNANDLDQ